MPENSYVVTLKNRGLIHVEGEDRASFLQGLITNDINKATPGAIIYACLLTPQGKFLHDFFIHNTGDAFLLDCEGGERAQDLYNRLIKYKMRAKVQVSVEENTPVYAILSNTEYQIPNTLQDPRHSALGHRSFIKPDLPEKPFEYWDLTRIQHTIPDGSRDLIPGKSTMDEAKMDTLGAVDYKKGCYIGQELTARMHYRGLGKKHLATIKLANAPENAEIRSQCGDYALALVRTES